MKLLVITLAVTSVALDPSLLFNKSVDATSHYFTDYKGKNQAWIDGCKQGWSDHDHCLEFNHGD